MKRWMLAAALAGLGFPLAAQAAGELYMNDVNIVYQPTPASYQPQGSDYDLADAGKSFNIACIVTQGGHLGNCQAQANDLVDQNFIRIAVANVGQWMVGPKARDGGASVGRTFVVTCRYSRKDQPSAISIANGAS